MGRRVAMKTLLPDCADDPDERRRFLREARVTAQLQHPNPVPVYEMGRHEDGWLFFTMKCIAGEDLFKVLQRLSWSDNVTVEQFPTGRLVDIAVQACQACAYAHAHGVVHRDLKPENIWVGEFGEVIVLDWGVSKVWGATDPVVDGLGTPVLDTELDQDFRRSRVSGSAREPHCTCRRNRSWASTRLTSGPTCSAWAWFFTKCSHCENRFGAGRCGRPSRISCTMIRSRFGSPLPNGGFPSPWSPSSSRPSKRSGRAHQSMVELIDGWNRSPVICRWTESEPVTAA
ncbi:MAG: hypothetical protein CM1200mP2_55280 [Planctomycetaceae bacterium]|nr:MAG: hypothetical protein CM1200mP2_55280 [Planctomycetaceae bacterium]